METKKWHAIVPFPRLFRVSNGEDSDSIYGKILYMKYKKTKRLCV
jgi:hypothetical protein